VRAKSTLRLQPAVKKLSASDLKNLALVDDGCDVMAPTLAVALRAIQRRRPELLWIGAAMGVYRAGVHHPYFGAKLTAAGKAAIATGKGGAS
jgi:hypothetical protein